MARSTPAQKPRGLASTTSISGTRCSRNIAPLAEAVENEQRGADGDRAVGDIERGISPRFVVKQKEIDDLADHQSIPQITDRTAEHEAQAEAIHDAAAALQQPCNDGRCDSGNGRKEPPLPSFRIREKAEG